MQPILYHRGVYTPIVDALVPLKSDQHSAAITT